MRYYEVCPRGFANEVTYIAVSDDQVAAVDKYFDGRADREFDHGNTNYSDGWTDDKRARAPGVAINWEDYLDL